jgi:hypothetical protein
MSVKTREYSFLINCINEAREESNTVRDCIPLKPSSAQTRNRLKLLLTSSTERGP